MDNIVFDLISGAYQPSDPNTHSRDMFHAQDQINAQPIPIHIQDAYNVMPTARGYSSYFGVSKIFGTDPLPPHIDDLITLKDELGNNIVLALAETGVYAQSGDLTTPIGVLTGTAFETQDYDY